MDTMVMADRVMIGPEFVPRRFDLPNVLQVQSGEVMTLPEDSFWGYIEVQAGGVLRLDRTRPIRCTFTHLINLGMLDFGTEADPVRAPVELILRDVPIDTTIDPFQWGNGLLNFGSQTRAGLSKTSCVTLPLGLDAGQSVILLPEEPLGWLVGDELLIPDTRFPTRADPARRETRITIAALTSRLLTLSKPLDFAHDVVQSPAWTHPATGEEHPAHGVVFPCICNLTRNLVIRSENLLGTTGHTANIGMNATWDLQSYQLVGLGRTRAEVLDNTNLTVTPPHIGTNQIGKYADHDHHTGAGGATSRRRNAVVIGNKRSKWGIVEHGTHFAEDEDNIVVDHTGAGYTTEDGPERGNRFIGNIAAYISGDLEQNNPSANVDHNAPGIEGSGYWFRGTKDIVLEDNQAWCCHTGFLLFNQQQRPGLYPSERGMMPDIPFTEATQRTALPARCKGNVAVANFGEGFEVWGANDFLNIDLVSVRNRDRQFVHFASPGTQPHLVNPTLIGSDGRGIGVGASMAYIENLTIEGGVIADCEVGVHEGGGRNLTTITGTRFQNVENIDLRNSGVKFEHTDVLHCELPGHSPRFITLGDGKVWNGQLPLPNDAGVGHLPPCRGSQYFVRNWQGFAEDYLLFHKQQLASNPAPWSSGKPGEIKYNVPEVGLTTREAWAKYGLAFRGEALEDADKVLLVGLIGGWGRRGLVSPLGPPGAVLMSPTMRDPAVLDSVGRGIEVYCAITGDPTQATLDLWWNLDGGGLEGSFDQRGGQVLDERRFFVPALMEGIHTLKTWRVDLQGQKIQASERTAQFFVGAAPIQVIVPDVVGLTKEAAIFSLGLDGFVIGTLSERHSAIVHVGGVISQVPTSGTQVLRGSSVNLVISLGSAPPPPDLVTVPDVVGEGDVFATVMIQRAGLTLGNVRRVPHATVPLGQVISQSLTGGARVMRGSAMDLVVSDGPPLEVWKPVAFYLEKEQTGRRFRIVLGTGETFELDEKD